MYLASNNETCAAAQRTPLMRDQDRVRLGIRLVSDSDGDIGAYERRATVPTSTRDPIAMEAARLTETIRTERRRAQSTDTPDHFYVFANWSSEDVLYRALAALNTEGVKLGSMTVAGDRWSLYMVCERAAEEDTRTYYDMMPCDS